MSAPRRLGRVVVAAAAAVLAGGLAANALWSDGRQSLEPAMQTGAVSFAAQVGHDASTRVVSTVGEAVTLTIPGSELIRVLDQRGPDPEPVFWHFRMTGAAMGITGLVADVRATAQVAADGTTHDLTTGIAEAGTVLAGSVVKIYPAAAGGDCSAVPDVPAGQEDRNVLVYDGEADQVQAAGVNPEGDLVTREWCVAMDWIDDPDGLYVNEVQVIGTAEDGTVNTGLAEWRSEIAFPRQLDPLGTYVNEAWVEALAMDGTTSRDSDSWSAVVYPDPSSEPGIQLTLDPSITNLNPQVATGDQPVFTTP
ncbi:hypothetical protein [Cellulomonas denverensis]|uniref:Uncharacterized protein n=1 Tax=Cellulomonas denverensis TaxID=264297 RepID=A0A7X6KYJ5_9CELL|nr:hypothetical protein [Cellulomonas denverensis]NKY24425.1 hypothetical protein [Cellulomonas denverensis]GIG26597.1 hypothetical protein Cde04nite_28410 [Cellulomonas denverensis]